MNLKFRHWRLWHWLTLALAIRLFKLTQVYCIAKDGTRYIDVARSWLNGTGGFHPVWPPLYPWLISLLMRLGIEPEFSGQFISVIFGVLTVALVYKTTKSMFSPNLAQVSTMFAVFHPFLVRYSAEVLADSLFSFLIIAVVFCGWWGLYKNGFTPTPKSLMGGFNPHQGSGTRFIPALFVGVGTAMAYLTKPEGILLGVVVSLWWLFVKKSWYKKLVIIFCIWGIFLVLTFPYLYSIHKETGRWMISQKQNIVFSTALLEGGFTDKFLNVSPLEYAIDEPRAFLIKVGNDLLTLLGRFPDAYHPFLFIFLVIGLTTKWKPNQRKALGYILSFLILYFLGYAIFHPGRRYLVSWVPLTLFLAAGGYQRATDWLSKPPHQKFWCEDKWRIGNILLLIMILTLIPKTLEPVRKKGAMWKEAGLWIKQYSEEGPTVMARDGRVAFYGQAKYVPWSEDKFDEVDYIVIKEDISNMKETYRTPHGLRIYHGSDFTK